MNFHILTLFPDMVMQGLGTSIIGRAVNNGLLSIEAVNIRDYAFNKHQSVDDYPYGGGAGMLMQAEPVYQAYEAIAENVKKKPRVVYLSPQGATFSQTMAEELANEEHLGDNWGENPESIIIDQENVQDLEQEITATLSPMENQVLEYYLWIWVFFP